MLILAMMQQRKKVRWADLEAQQYRLPMSIELESDFASNIHMLKMFFVNRIHRIGESLGIFD